MRSSPTVDAVMAAERASQFTKRSIKTHSKQSGLTLALSMLDLTTLEGKDSPEKARSLCRKAERSFDRDIEVLGQTLPACAAVCVYPSLVKTCRETLGEVSPVKIASVATGFPSGQYPLHVRIEDTRRAVEDGADEIDMVISRGAFLAGRHDEVAEEIRAIKRACRKSDGSAAHLKVILETGELETLDNVRVASDLAIRAMADVDAEWAREGHVHDPRTGGDFIKTSTGKVTPAATMPVTLVMLEAIRDWYLSTGRVVGMKPAGGIRTSKQALHYLVMVKETMGGLAVEGFEEAGGCPWLTPLYFRFGASALCNDILRQLVKLKTGKYAAAHDFSEA